MLQLMLDGFLQGDELRELHTEKQKYKLQMHGSTKFLKETTSNSVFLEEAGKKEGKLKPNTGARPARPRRAWRVTLRD